jgi:hypothetical protein
MLKVIGVDCSDRETKELRHPVFGVSPRHMAQTLGTEWMRKCIATDGWLRLAHQYVEQQLARCAQGEAPAFKGVVFSDVRFINEAEFIREHGTLVHVWRPDVTPVAAHESENGIPFRDCDRALMNDKTVEVTFRRLDDIMADL